MSEKVLPLIVALEKQAFGGVIVPGAVELLHNTVAASAQVINGEICFNVDGKMLNVEETTAALLKAHRALFAPVKAADPDPDTIKLDAIKERAAAGNVTAHGELYKQLGPEGYEAWKAENGATPGKRPVGRPRTHDKDETINPWSADHWNITDQGKIIRALGPEKAAAMAKAAGVTIGATKPAA